MNIKVQHLENLIKDKREFDVIDLHNAIKFNPIYWSWGVSHYSNYHKKGLGLKVNGHHFQGVVFITLHFSDTFSIYFIEQMEVKKELHLVYIDDLLRTIDKEVEYIKEYENN